MIQRKLAEVGLGWNCSIGRDASIRLDELNTRIRTDIWGRTVRVNVYEGHEIRLLSTEEDLKSNIEKLNKVMNYIKPKINDSCGLHVHLDMRNRNADECYDKLLKAQTQMYKMQPKERKNNRHSGRRATTTSNGKYYAINRSSDREKKTIEVRLHSGCTDIIDILNWTNFLVKIVDSKTKAKRFTKPFYKRILGEDTYDYMVERESRFA